MRSDNWKMLEKTEKCWKEVSVYQNPTVWTQGNECMRSVSCFSFFETHEFRMTCECMRSESRHSVVKLFKTMILLFKILKIGIGKRKFPWLFGTLVYWCRFQSALSYLVFHIGLNFRCFRVAFRSFFFFFWRFQFMSGPVWAISKLYATC